MKKIFLTMALSVLTTIITAQEAQAGRFQKDTSCTTTVSAFETQVQSCEVQCSNPDILLLFCRGPSLTLHLRGVDMSGQLFDTPFREIDGNTTIYRSCVTSGGRKFLREQITERVCSGSSSNF